MFNYANEPAESGLESVELVLSNYSGEVHISVGVSVCVDKDLFQLMNYATICRLLFDTGLSENVKSLLKTVNDFISIKVQNFIGDGGSYGQIT